MPSIVLSIMFHGLNIDKNRMSKTETKTEAVPLRNSRLERA